MTFSASECFNHVWASCGLAERLRRRFSGITGPYVKVFIGLWLAQGLCFRAVRIGAEPLQAWQARNQIQ